jgi:hypothetical protein
MSQLCQMQALSTSSRSTMRAHRFAGMRPPWRSWPNWLFSVQMTAWTRWRSQFGNSARLPLVLAGGADQGQARVWACEDLWTLFTAREEHRNENRR